MGSPLPSFISFSTRKRERERERKKKIALKLIRFE